MPAALILHQLFSEAYGAIEHEGRSWEWVILAFFRP